MTTDGVTHRWGSQGAADVFFSLAVTPSAARLIFICLDMYEKSRASTCEANACPLTAATSFREVTAAAPNDEHDGN